MCISMEYPVKAHPSLSGHTKLTDPLQTPIQSILISSHENSIESLIRQSVANESANAVVISAEATQLHLLGVLDFFSIAVSPFHGYFRIRICVNQNIEGAISV